ncbi:hypothetical protein [Bosea sp. (in: a-proteobacteria)]|uniref:hypothetical protein n=1 Tax=Bosea sp. (in: a-proteobacteria) TaxID=1871050 RepID=UPI002FC5BBF1
MSELGRRCPARYSAKVAEILAVAAKLSSSVMQDPTGCMGTHGANEVRAFCTDQSAVLRQDSLDRAETP